MVHESELFNFQAIINRLREKVSDSDPDDEKTEYLMSLYTITKETELEDLPLYKDYLSKFDVEHDLKGLKLSYDPDYDTCADDFLLLLKFIASSTSSTYSLDYDVDTDKVVLAITVSSNGQTITKRLDELFSFQITRLFEIYLDEQLKLTIYREIYEDEREDIDKNRNMQLIVYQKKIRLLKQQRERILNNQKASDDILSSLDNLLLN